MLAFYLEHKVGDDPMEDCVLVGESLPVLTRSKGNKVGHSSRHNLVKQLQVDDSKVFVVCGYSELDPDLPVIANIN